MNIIFNASAGTGKTWQVTELYCSLVLGREHPKLGRISDHPVPPEKILLMTFTDNAAAELRAKVSEKLIAAEEENDLARSVLRRLPAASISTIHAFCAGLLREHALELGLSPVFQTLEEEERDSLLDEVLKTEIFQTLEPDPDFRDFCAGISVLNGDYSVLNTIKSLLEKAASRGLRLTEAEAMLPDPVPTVGKRDFQRIHDELAAFAKLPPKASAVFQALEKICRPGDLTRRIPEIESLTKFTGTGMKPISDELAELKERFLTETLYAENVEKFRAFARCLARCADGFAEAKRLRDCADFGDQLLFARDLLKNNSFDAPPFEWIIVDEVQDTSRVQCEVIEALWGPKTSLVICGDKKQSIYAWRSADPDVMPDLEKAMAQRGEYKRIPLTKSFRSKDRVIQAVNALFEGLYESYDALEPREQLHGEKPCVEFLEADHEEQGSDEEMAAVARRIQLLVNGDDAWRPRFRYDKASDTFLEGQHFGYGDILVLMKRSTHQAALEKALRDAGIPYSSGGKGKELFDQQEVRDLLLFLQAVTRPQNDLALVGFLRSPFMNLSDDEIVQLGWDGETFDHEILRRQFLETEKAARLIRYRAEVGNKLPSQLVRDIVRETAFDADLAGQPGGEQKLANFKKALDWIRAAERGGQVLIGDVVRRFERAIQTPPKSGSAEALLPDPEQNAVTIMTVHGAKGLTQRVCFVPDISFGDQPEKGFAVFSQHGSLELKLTAIDESDIKSPGWKAAREADKAVRGAESLNVFYVAMTRARDLVVFSGSGTQKANGWLKTADGFIAGASPDILRTLKFGDLPQAEEAGKLETRNLKLDINFQSLEIPKAIERKAVTALVELLEPKAQRLKPVSADRRSFGTLGHLVLEALAKNRWQGDVAELLRQFSSIQYEGLADQLEAAREVLAEETSGAEALFAEHPFVLKRDDLILDGTIDLLVRQSSNAWKILDYKFSNERPEAALETYEPQLAAYKEAVEKLHPGGEVSAALVLIGETVKVISLRG